MLEEYGLTHWKDYDVESDIGWSRIANPSSWIWELSKEPLVGLHHPTLLHYVIVTEDDVIEVLADREPKIETLRALDNNEPLSGKSIIYFKKGEPTH